MYQKLGKVSQNLSSAAVMIVALRVKKKQFEMVHLSGGLFVDFRAKNSSVSKKANIGESFQDYS